MIFNKVVFKITPAAMGDKIAEDVVTLIVGVEILK